MPGAYTINFIELTARGFKDTAAANYFATGGEDVVARDVGVAECLATNDQLKAFLKKLNPSGKVPDDRAGLAKAIWAALEQKIEVDMGKVAPPPAARAYIAPLGREVSNDRDRPAQAPGPRPTAKPKQQPGAPVRSAMASGGQYIYPTKTTNPRREGTHGWNSMKIVLEEPGITTAEYFKRGGRPNDLKWDIEKGNVVVEPQKRS